jgi:hypothetical protein
VLIYLATKDDMERVFARALEKGICWSFWQYKRLFKEREEREQKEKENTSDNQRAEGSIMPPLKEREIIVLETLS